MGRRALVDPDTDIAIGIMIGAEWSNEDIARHFGVTTQALAMRKKRRRDRGNAIIDNVINWTRIAISKYVEARLQAAEQDFEARKKELRKKSYRLVEKTVDHGLSDEVTRPDQTHLHAAEIGIERVEGKALDRKAILSREEKIYRVDVDGSELDGLLHELAVITERRKLLVAPAEEDANDSRSGPVAASSENTPD